MFKSLPVLFLLAACGSADHQHTESAPVVASEIYVVKPIIVRVETKPIRGHRD